MFGGNEPDPRGEARRPVESQEPGSLARDRGCRYGVDALQSPQRVAYRLSPGIFAKSWPSPSALLSPRRPDGGIRSSGRAWSSPTGCPGQLVDSGERRNAMDFRKGLWWDTNTQESPTRSKARCWLPGGVTTSSSCSRAWATRRPPAPSASPRELVRCGRNGRTRSTGRNETPCAEWTEAAMPQPKPTGPRYLSTDERIFIADGLVCGLSMSAIASRLGRSRSTVCREVARNRDLNLNLNLNLNPPRIRCRLGFHFDMMSGGLGASLPKHSVGFKKYVAEFYCFTEGAVCL